MEEKKLECPTRVLNHPETVASGYSGDHEMLLMTSAVEDGLGRV